MKNKPSVLVIKKKRKSHGHGHHGGSWKIAYADFMTAMMAFFLVMWLLASSSPASRAQIAEYFKVPLKTTLAKGEQSSLSSSIVPGGGDDMMKKVGEMMKQDAATKQRHQQEMTKLRHLRERLELLIKSDPRLKKLAPNLRITLLDDGLRILIIDSQKRPMFQLGRSTVEPYMSDILRALAPVLNDIPNRISISGHTDDLPYASGNSGYSNWELSTDRANASRRELVIGGLHAEKILRIVGMSDTMNLKNVSGDTPENRRITLLVLTHDKEESILKENVDGEDIKIDGSPEALQAQFSSSPPQVLAPASQTVPAPAKQDVEKATSVSKTIPAVQKVEAGVAPAGPRSGLN